MLACARALGEHEAIAAPLVHERAETLPFLEAFGVVEAAGVEAGQPEERLEPFGLDRVPLDKLVVRHLLPDERVASYERLEMLGYRVLELDELAGLVERVDGFLGFALGPTAGG